MRKSVYLLGNDDPQWVSEVEINNKIVKLPDEVRNYAIYDDKVIIVLSKTFIEEKFPQKNPGRNIWCYRDDGKLLWKIEESPHYREWFAKQPWYRRWSLKRKGYVDCYTQIYYNEEYDKLLAQVQTGAYRLDPETGKVYDFVYDEWR